MKFKTEQILFMGGISMLFFMFGIFIGGFSAISTKGDWYIKGQQSCKVCEVVRYGNESKK